MVSLQIELFFSLLSFELFVKNIMQCLLLRKKFTVEENPNPNPNPNPL